MNGRRPDGPLLAGGFRPAAHGIDVACSPHRTQIPPRRGGDYSESMRVLTSFADIPPAPWANGAGETTELVSVQESARLTPALRPWRLSVAKLERLGPFSSLPTYARTFIPLDAEVVLRIEGTVHRVPPGQPLRFHGRDEVELVEMGAAGYALNLMVADADPGSTDGMAAESSVARQSVLSLSGPELSLKRPSRLDEGHELFAVTVNVADSTKTTGAIKVTDSTKTTGATKVTDTFNGTDTSAEYTRFQLIHLDESDVLPDHLGVVYLH